MIRKLSKAHYGFFDRFETSECSSLGTDLLCVAHLEPRSLSPEQLLRELSSRARSICALILTHQNP